jgi:predicted aminopeptidase
LANAHLDLAAKLAEKEDRSGAKQRLRGSSDGLVWRPAESGLTGRTGARDYFAEYHAAIAAYRKELEKVFGFAFMPEDDDSGKHAAPGSALRNAYDAMVKARKERDERHPPGTWIG